MSRDLESDMPDHESHILLPNGMMRVFMDEQDVTQDDHGTPRM